MRARELALSASLWLCMPALGAAEQLPATVEAPASEQVRQMIRELASVRDYERLGWILAAIDRQVPPARADLLQALDGQVQGLLQTEIERRSLAAATGVPAPETRHTTAKTAQVPNAARTAPPADAAIPKASWIEPQDSAAVAQAIDDTQLAADPHTRLEQTRRISRMIMGVQSAEERQRLSEQLQQRTSELFAERIHERQGELDRLASEAETAGR